MSADAIFQEVPKGSATPEASKGFWVKCGACAHCWVAAFYPGNGLRFSRTARANSRACPKCGHKKVWVAKQNDGVLLEPQP